LAGLHQVELAMSRLDAGSYGICVRCEEEISLARLSVRPRAPARVETTSHSFTVSFRIGNSEFGLAYGARKRVDHCSVILYI